MQTLFDLLPYACVAYVAFKVGQHWAFFTFTQRLSQNPDDMIKVLNQVKAINRDIEVEGMPEDAHPMLIERQGGQLYAYDQITGQFMAQAQDLSALMALIDQRFPGKKFFGTLRKDDPAKQLAN
jgi:hypothetical protein